MPTRKIKLDTKKMKMQTSTAAGDAAEARIATAEAALYLYNQFQTEDTEDAARRGIIQQMIDGNPPYKQEDLDAYGLKNLTNVNFGGLAGIMKGRGLAYATLAVDNSSLVELRIAKNVENVPDLQNHGEVIADEFSLMVRDWAGFVPLLSMVGLEADAYGLGPAVYPDDWDWRPDACKRGAIKFPADASSDYTRNSIYMIEATMDAGHFFRLVKNPTAAAAAGWDVDAIKAYLVETYVDDSPTESQAGDVKGRSVVESYQQLIKDNAFLEQIQFDVLRVIHVYVKEVSGPQKVSHLILPARAEAALTEKDKNKVDRPAAKFLCRRLQKYDSMEQCVWWLPYDYGDGTARSVRGLASMIAAQDDVSNRLLCSIYDAAIRSAAFVLQPKGTMGVEDMTFFEMGPYLMLPPNVTTAQSQIVAPNLGSLAQIREMGQNIAQNNALGTSMSMAGLPERPYSGADRKTKMEVAEEASARSNSANQGYIVRILALDRLFREMFRRAIRMATGEVPSTVSGGRIEVEEFKDRCLNRGVPEDVFNKVLEYFRVYTSRDLLRGGSAAVAAAISQSVTMFAGMFDENGRVNATRDYLRCTLGGYRADRYRPENTRDRDATNAASFAELENNSMRSGEPVMVGTDQLHWTHIPHHWEIIETIVKAYMNNQVQDPGQALRILSLAAQHTMEHVGYGGKQPGMEPQAKQYKENLTKLAPIIKGLQFAAAAIEQQQRQAQEAQARAAEEANGRATNQELALGMADISTKAKLEVMKQDSLNKAREQKTGEKLRLDRFAAVERAKLEQYVANSKLAIEARKALGANTEQSTGD